MYRRSRKRSRWFSVGRSLSRGMFFVSKSSISLAFSEFFEISSELLREVLLDERSVINSRTSSISMRAIGSIIRTLENIRHANVKMRRNSPIFE